MLTSHEQPFGGVSTPMNIHPKGSYTPMLDALPETLVRVSEVVVPFFHATRRDVRRRGAGAPGAGVRRDATMRAVSAHRPALISALHAPRYIEAALGNAPVDAPGSSVCVSNNAGSCHRGEIAANATSCEHSNAMMQIAPRHTNSRQLGV